MSIPRQPRGTDPEFARTTPEIDECRIIILKMIEGAIRDYLSLGESSNPTEMWDYLTAECFLFEDEYYIRWGDEEKSLRDFLDILSIDINWLRDKVQLLRRAR